jgi:hypothetical protein
MKTAMNYAFRILSLSIAFIVLFNGRKHLAIAVKVVQLAAVDENDLIKQKY